MRGRASLQNPDSPLSDGVVALRPWLETDSACIEEAGHDPSVCEGFGVPARGGAQVHAWLRRESRRQENGEGLSLALADAVSGEALGGVLLMLRPQPGNAAIGYWVVPRARRRGLASRAVGLLSRWALSETGLARVEALVEPDNEPSQRVIENAGFQREGLLRSRLAFAERRADALIYSLISSDLA